MVKVVGVKFKSVGKMYYFDPDDFELPLGTNVIVETARGMEFGTVSLEPTEVDESEIVSPLKKIIRKASEQDKAQHEENIKKGKSASNLSGKNRQARARYETDRCGIHIR